MSWGDNCPFSPRQTKAGHEAAWQATPSRGPPAGACQPMRQDRGRGARSASIAGAGCAAADTSALQLRPPDRSRCPAGPSIRPTVRDKSYLFGPGQRIGNAVVRAGRIEQRLDRRGPHRRQLGKAAAAGRLQDAGDLRTDAFDRLQVVSPRAGAASRTGTRRRPPTRSGFPPRQASGCAPAGRRSCASAGACPCPRRPAPAPAGP